MPDLKAMRQGLPESAPGGHREKTFQLGAGRNKSDSEDQRERIGRFQSELRGLFAAMVRKAGGVDWLTAQLDQRPSYESKITEAINGSVDRKIQLDWMAPLLEDDAAVELLMGWLSDTLGYEPPVRRRHVTREQIAEAAVEVIGEMGALRDPVREAIAKRLGVRPDEIKL